MNTHSWRKWFLLVLTGGVVFQTATSCQGQIIDMVMQTAISAATSAISSAITGAISGALTGTTA